MRPRTPTLDRGDNAGMDLSASVAYRALLLSLRLAWAGFAFGAAMMLPVLILRASGLVVLVQIGFVEAFAACGVAVVAFALSLPRVTGTVLDEPRTIGRRAGALVASAMADVLDPEWS